jgi:hypothetical protein
MFAVGDDGTILRRARGQWELEQSGTDRKLAAVWGSSGRDVFAVGEKGTIVHYDGERWAPQPSGTERGLAAVWGSGPSDLFVAGEGGLVLHYDGKRWAAQSTRTEAGLAAIWGSGPTDVFAVGNDGAVIHYDGSKWTAQPSGTTGALTAVWGSGPSDVFAVGASLLHYDGRAWSEPWTKGVGHDLAAVWGSGPTNVYAVGGHGVVLRYDGRSWVAEDGGTDTWLGGVWGLGPDDLYAVGGVGTIVHHAGPARSGAEQTAAQSPNTASAGARPRFELATYCQGEPRTAKWTVIHPDQDVPASPEAGHCYLPAVGDRVELDQYGMRGCVQDIATPLQKRMQEPKEIFFRVVGLEGDATLQVRARIELGQPCGGFCSEGWGPWHTIVQDKAGGGRIFRLPWRTVRDEAKYRLELLLELRNAAGVLLAERLVSIFWAVDC